MASQLLILRTNNFFEKNRICLHLTILKNPVSFSFRYK